MPKKIPTVVVKNKQGHLMRINVTDFDPKIHKPAGEDAPKAAERPREPEPDSVETLKKKVAAATTLKALESIANEMGVELPEDAKTLVAARAHLLAYAP